MAVVAGLWLFDALDREVFNPFTANVTALGFLSTGKSNGSFTHPRFATGRPVVLSALAEEGTTFVIPDILINGNTISWTFKQSGSNANQSVRIGFGVRA
jgi:hypothetical protein